MGTIRSSILSNAQFNSGITYLPPNPTDTGSELQTDVVYISTTGNDGGSGSLSDPWATWKKGFDTASVLENVIIRGGTYYITDSNDLISLTNITRDGSDINITNYPGEKPILDLSGLTGSYDAILLESCSNWNITGLGIQNVQTGSGIHVSYCGNISLYNMTAHDCSDIGFKFGYVQDDIGVYNCDSYNNQDGYQTYASNTSENHLLYVTMSFNQSRAWNNSRHGFNIDAYDGMALLNNCWSFNNGSYGIGLGTGWVDTEFRVMQKCLSVGNNIGFQYQGPTSTLKFYNCTVYDNIISGYDLRCSNILYNNLSYQNTVDYVGDYTGTNNNWDIPSITVTDNEFQSIDSSSISSTRRPNGQLPILTFLRPTFGSQLKDAGVNVGLSYSNDAPDIGCFEYSSSILPDPIITVLWNGVKTLTEIDTPTNKPLTFESHELTTNYSPDNTDWFQYNSVNSEVRMAEYYDNVRGEIANHGTAAGARGLQLLYPAASSWTTNTGSKETGMYLTAQIDDGTNNWEELYLSYNVFLETGWDWAQGMSLPGLRVKFDSWGDIRQPTGSEGSYVTIGVDTAGYLRFYHYEHIVNDGPNPISNRSLKNFGFLSNSMTTKLSINQWNNITLRMVLNTPGEEDGFAECFLNGAFVGRLETVMWREDASNFIDCIEWSAFNGYDPLEGNGSAWAPTNNQYAHFDDVTAFYYENIDENVDIPIGFNYSAVDRNISNELPSYPKLYDPNPTPSSYTEIFSQDFQNSDLGVYTGADVLSEFGPYRYSNGIGWNDIYSCTVIDNEVGGKSLQVINKAGDFGLNESGVQFEKEITEAARDELYMSYNVKWTPSNFDAKLGGKLPGLKSASGGGGGSGPLPGFSARLMFKDNGALAFYLYWPDMPGIYGSHVGGYFDDPENPGTDFSFYGRDWTNITTRISLGPVGAYQDFIEGFIDGILVHQVSGLRLRTTTDEGIDYMAMNYFFGGNTVDWAPDYDTFVELDDIILFHFNDGTANDIPGPRVLSKPGRDLSPYLPNLGKVTPPSTQKNIFTVFSNNFSHDSIGNYWYTGDWKRDFGSNLLCADGYRLDLPWAQNIDLTIITDYAGSRCLRSAHKQGTIQADEGNGILCTPNIVSSDGGSANIEELYWSYNIYYPADFEIPIGMKGSGMAGGGWYDYSPPPGLQNYYGTMRTFAEPGYFYDYNWGSGMSGAIINNNNMFVTYGYIYFHDKGISKFSYGLTVGPNINHSASILQKGKWNNITYRAAMNTVRQWIPGVDVNTRNPTPGNSNEFYVGDIYGNLYPNPTWIGNRDGIYEIFVNGVLTTQKTGIRWRNLPSQYIDEVRAYTHHGGGSSDFAPSKDVYCYLDDYTGFWFPNNTGNTNVPIGRTASPSNRNISDVLTWMK